MNATLDPIDTLFSPFIMATEELSDSVLKNSNRLVGYSFDSLIQLHARRLLENETAQAAAGLEHAGLPGCPRKESNPATLRANAIAHEKRIARRKTRRNSLLIASFLLGVSGYFLSFGLPGDFISGTRDALQAMTSVRASERVPTAVMQAQYQAQPVQTMQQADPAPAVPKALVAQPEPVRAEEAAAPAVQEQAGARALDKSDDGCTGARLAFGLCFEGMAAK